MPVRTESIVVEGAATAQQVVVPDHTRQYLGLYAKVGSCLISVGESTHADTALTLAQGNIFEPSPGASAYYSAASTELVVLQDLAANAVLTSDKKVLTSDGETLYYNPRQ